ncbi:hypothetical protein NESM_000064700 [Novymonas esmeraldas]|uniref:Uncharacterized protein n=1 Tax=Novymonas esmeraldas TaxID=1808958 RepID=A0AAW0F1R8_9TRYP
MDGTAELAGLVRRLPPQVYERVLLLLHCLLCSNQDSSANVGVHTLSLSAICDIVLAACPGPVPRFVLALSSNDKLLRSADGGHTWRRCFSRTNEPIQAAAATATNLLDDVTALLQSTETTSDEATGGGGGDGGASSVVCSADGRGDVVALCGLHGFFAVSGDRGVTFTTATNYLSGYLGENADLRHVCVLDPSHILVSDGLRVVRVAVQCPGYGPLALGKARVVLVCTCQVCLMRTCSSSGGVVVAENGKLHLSFDSAATFLEVRHSLGRIRDCDAAAAALRRCELPAFPATALETSLGLPVADGSTASPRRAAPYEYVSGYKCDVATRAEAATLAAAVASFETGAVRHGADVFYRFFFVVGVGAEVLPYDYSAMLCVCTRRDDESIVVMSTAAHVSYIPFSQSRSHEQLLCAVARCRDGDGGNLIASRGSSVGTSVSRDLDRWSTARGGAPVGLLSVGGGDILVCGRNKVVSRVGGSAETHTIPNEMRAPLLTAAFAM